MNEALLIKKKKQEVIMVLNGTKIKWYSSTKRHRSTLYNLIYRIIHIFLLSYLE